MTTEAADQCAVKAKTVCKVRAPIIPFVLALFVVAVLDRNNIGFAALTINKELGIASEQYGLVAGIFFFGYFIFEISSNTEDRARVMAMLLEFDLDNLPFGLAFVG